MITGVWINSAHDRIAVQVDDETLIEYNPNDSDGYELDVIGFDWTTYIPEHTPGGIDHTTCIALEQA